MTPLKMLIFGGSFNPPHLRHVSLAEQAAAATGADQIRVIPANMNPQRQTTPPAAAQHRVAMLRIAFLQQPLAVIDPIELERGGASFTVDTLESLHKQFPFTQFFLLLGGDQMLNFYSWREPQKILSLATPVVIPRAPLDALALVEQLTRLHGADVAAPWHKWILALEPSADSSTQLRHNILAGASLDETQIDPAVLAYIRTHALYQTAPRKKN